MTTIPLGSKIWIIGCFMLFGNLFGQTNSASDIKNQLKLQIREILTTDSIPQMAYAVVSKEGILLSDAIGHHRWSERNAPENAQLTDFFHLGSNTKAITAFLAGYFVEQGQLSWDTPFFKLFPEWKKKARKEYYQITLADLLSHRARVPAFTDGVEFESLPEKRINKQEDRQVFAQHVLAMSALSSDVTYNYSNAGYTLAALMLEKASGKTWEELCESILKNQLQFNFVQGWPNRNLENQPYGHWDAMGFLAEVPAHTNYNLDRVEPAGDLSMDVESYARFIQLNLKGLAGERAFLKPETYRYLHRSRPEYAMGWISKTEGEHVILGHAGSDGTFFMFARLDSKLGLGYVVMANVGTQKGQMAVITLLKHLLTLQI